MSTRYPLVLIANDIPGHPSGPARVKSLLKLLGRRFNLQVEWLPTGTPTIPVATKQKRGKAARSADEPTITSSEMATPQIACKSPTGETSDE